jgi:hypothetical protein
MAGWGTGRCESLHRGGGVMNLWVRSCKSRFHLDVEGAGETPEKPCGCPNMGLLVDMRCQEYSGGPENHEPQPGQNPSIASIQVRDIIHRSLNPLPFPRPTPQRQAPQQQRYSQGVRSPQRVPSSTETPTRTNTNHNKLLSPLFQSPKSVTAFYHCPSQHNLIISIQ